MPFKSEKQRRWMHLHHPEIAGDWEKKYKKGGFVEDSKEANKAGDVVDAKLSPGELILNGQHLAKVEEMTGVPAEQFWAEVGVPGFEGGQNPMEARGGGVSKKDYLMKYQDSGVAHRSKYPIENVEGIDYHVDPVTRKPVMSTLQEINKPWRLSDDPWTLVTQGTGKHKFFDTKEDWQQHGEMLKEKYFTPKPTTQGKPMSTKKYEGMAGGGIAKKKYLMGYRHGGVEHGDGSNILDITRNIAQRERFSQDRPGISELTYKPQREYYTEAAKMAIEDFDWNKKKQLTRSK